MTKNLAPAILAIALPERVKGSTQAQPSIHVTRDAGMLKGCSNARHVSLARLVLNKFVQVISRERSLRFFMESLLAASSDLAVIVGRMRITRVSAFLSHSGIISATVRLKREAF